MSVCSIRLSRPLLASIIQLAVHPSDELVSRIIAVPRTGTFAHCGLSYPLSMNAFQAVALERSSAERAGIGQPDRFLKLAEVKRRVGLGKSMIYQMIKEGAFPAPY